MKEENKFVNLTIDGNHFLNFERPASDWQCRMFGMEYYILRPYKGDEPNWFWRTMQYLAFGNKWEKVK